MATEEVAGVSGNLVKDTDYSASVKYVKADEEGNYDNTTATTTAPVTVGTYKVIVEITIINGNYETATTPLVVEKEDSIFEIEDWIEYYTMEIGENFKTEYAYGEALDVDNVHLIANMASNKKQILDPKEYTLTSTYNPRKIGENQQIIITCIPNGQTKGVVEICYVTVTGKDGGLKETDFTVTNNEYTYDENVKKATVTPKLEIIDDIVYTTKYYKVTDGVQEENPTKLPINA